MIWMDSMSQEDHKILVLHPCHSDLPHSAWLCIYSTLIAFGTTKHNQTKTADNQGHKDMGGQYVPGGPQYISASSLPFRLAIFCMAVLLQYFDRIWHNQAQPN